jgi:hypothetical protein
MTKKSKKEKKPFKERFENEPTNEVFLNSLSGLQPPQLKDTVVVLSKHLEGIQFTLETKDEILAAQKELDAIQEILDEKKANLKEITKEFTDTEKSLKDKIRYVTLILKEKTPTKDGGYEA